MFLGNKFAVPATILMVVVSGFVLLTTKKNTLSYKFLSSTTMLYIGKISYSLFLWHWGILAISRWTVGLHWWSIPIQIFLISFLSILSFEFIENRFAQDSAYIISPIALSNGILVVVTASSLMVLYFIHPFLFLSRIYDIKIHERFLPFRNKPYDPTCVLDSGFRKLNTTTLTDCTIAPTNYRLPTIWAFGDSHAGHLNGALHSLHENLGLGFHLIETPGQPFPQSGELFLVDRDIAFKRTLILMKRGDVILLKRLYISVESRIPSPDFDRWVDMVVELSNIVKNKGIRVFVMTPTPIFLTDSGKCNSTFFANINDDCFQSSESFEQSFGSIIKKLKITAKTNQNITLIDPTSVLCTGNGIRYCSRSLNKNALYIDDDHLNIYGGSVLADLIQKSLLNNVSIH